MFGLYPADVVNDLRDMTIEIMEEHSEVSKSIPFDIPVIIIEEDEDREDCPF